VSNPESRGATRVIAIACLIFGTAWLAIGAPFFFRQLEVQRHWPRVNATLLSASVIEDDPAAGGKLYKTRFEFTLESSSGPRPAIVDGYRISSDRSKVEAEAARFHPGAQYSVRGNPHDLNEIRLDVDNPFRHFFLPLLFGSIATVFFLISASIFFFSRR
jgi:hypothetical protein